MKNIRHNLFFWIGGIFVITACVRCVVLYMFSGTLGFVAAYPDETNYYLPAAQMLRESIQGFFGSPRSLWNGPLNPLWLAALGGDVAVAKFANVILFSFSSAVLAGAVSCRFGCRKGCLVALGLLLYPPTFDLVPTVLTEPLYVSLLCLSFAVLIIGEFSLKSFCYSGALFGLATLVRPTSQMFSPLLILIGTFYWRTPRGRLFILHGVCALVVCIPTMTWNFVQFGKVGIANGVGAVLYVGGDLRRDGDEPVYSGVDFDTYRHTAPNTHLDTEGDLRLATIAKERMLHHPLATARLFVRKTFRYALGSQKGYFWPFDGLVDKLRHEASLKGKLFTLLWPGLHVLVVCGALISLRRRDISPVLRSYVGLLTLYFVALHAVTFPIPRMVFPLYPYLLVLAVLGICTRGGGNKTRLAVFIVTPLVFGFVSAPRHQQFWTEVDESFSSVFEVRYMGLPEYSQDIENQVVVGEDPFVVSRFDGVSMLRSQMVHFRTQVHCPEEKIREGNGQIFWKIGVEPFIEGKSMVFPMRSISTSHVVRPGLLNTWTGGLTGLRVDLPAEWKGCKVSISDIQVLD